MPPEAQPSFGPKGRLLPHQTIPGLVATCFPSTATSPEYERVTSRGRLPCLHRAGGTTECSERNSWRSWRPWWQSPEFAEFLGGGGSRSKRLFVDQTVCRLHSQILLLDERNKSRLWAKHGWSTVHAHPNKRFPVEVDFVEEVVDDVHHILSSGHGLERFAEEEIFFLFEWDRPNERRLVAGTDSQRLSIRRVESRKTVILELHNNSVLDAVGHIKGKSESLYCAQPRWELTSYTAAYKTSPASHQSCVVSSPSQSCTRLCMMLSQLRSFADERSQLSPVSLSLYDFLSAWSIPAPCSAARDGCLEGAALTEMESPKNKNVNRFYQF